MARAPKRFIKKVPPSGGPPAFKLTLPHQVVHKHLLHLVDTDFELAPAPTAQQTWQGSIAPRRNKERSEYTLQGWKLFAEAHKVQAGDQVSFELVSSHRMVIQIIRPAETSPPSSADVQASPTKSLKQTASSSPGSRKQLPCLCPSEEDPVAQDLWYSTAALDAATALDDEVWQNFPEAAAQQLSAASEADSSQLDANRHLGIATQPFDVQQQAAPLSFRSRSLGSDGRFKASSPEDSTRQFTMGRSPGFGSYNSLPTGQSISSMRRPPRCSSMSTLQSNQASGSISTFFRDFSGPTDLHMTGLHQSSSLPDSFLNEEVPNLAEVPTSQTMASTSQLETQFNHLTATIQSLETDVKHFELRADKAESEAAQLRSMFDAMQSNLDRQSRKALRAATGLEKAAGRLAAPQLLAAVDSSTSESMREIQSDMFNCLGMLKGSLWQLLVLTIEQPEHTSHQQEWQPSPDARI